MPSELSEISVRLAEIGRRFDARGWVLGTSGNFSVVVSREPLRLVITSSGISKGELTADGIVEIDQAGQLTTPGTGRPSAEALLHVEIVRARGAGAVLHTHSMWSTLLSDRHMAGARSRRRRLRDAEGSSGRRDARAPRVDSDPRKRPGHGAACRSGARGAHRASRRHMHSFFAAMECTLGARRCRKPYGTSRSSSSCSKPSRGASEEVPHGPDQTPSGEHHPHRVRGRSELPRRLTASITRSGRPNIPSAPTQRQRRSSARTAGRSKR